MTQRQYLKIILILGLFFVSSGGWLLHLRLHSPAVAARNFVPFGAGILSSVLLPILFLFEVTTPYAYVINGMVVIVGTVTMSHFSLAIIRSRMGFPDILTNTLFPDILILWAAFAMGKALFELHLMKRTEERVRQARFLRYPSMGWWWVHLALASIVYYLGHVLWK